MANELECIITTGLFIFTLSSGGASGGEASMALQYVPSAQSVFPPITQVEEGGTPRTLPNSGNYHESGLSNGAHGANRTENWNREQINDFVRKLGFLDAQREGGDQIKHFLHINEVQYCAYKMNICNVHVNVNNRFSQYLPGCKQTLGIACSLEGSRSSTVSEAHCNPYPGV